MPIDSKDLVTDFLTEWSQSVMNQIRDNLVSKDQWFDQSTLAESINVLPVEAVNGGYMITIEMNDYGYWVDKGRKNSSKMPPIQPIKDWVTKRAIPTPLKIRVAVKTKRGIKMVNRNFKNTIEARDSIAWGVAIAVKRRGYISKGQGFYSEIVNDDMLQELAVSLGAKYGQLFEAQIVEP
jgi:hypothetical protein